MRCDCISFIARFVFVCGAKDLVRQLRDIIGVCAVAVLCVYACGKHIYDANPGRVSYIRGCVRVRVRALINIKEIKKGRLRQLWGEQKVFCTRLW